MIALMMLIIFAISPLFSGILGTALIILDRKRSIFYLFILALVIAYPALFFLPDLNYDATRIFTEMGNYNDSSSFVELYKNYIDVGSDYRTYPVFVFFMFVISKTGLFNLLPFLSAFFTYFLFLFPIVSEWKKGERRSSTVIVSLFGVFAWLSYVLTISGMRYYLAIAIYFFSMYIDIVRSDNKKNEKLIKKLIPWILYLLAVLIHPSMIVFLCITIASKLTKKHASVSAIVVAIAGFIVMNLQTFVGNGTNGYFTTLINRFTIYSENANFSSMRTIAIILREYVALFMILASIIFIIKKLFSHTPSANMEFTLFTFYSMVFTLSMFTKYNIYDRFIFFVIPLAILYYLLNISKDVSIITNIIFFVLIFSVILVGLNYNQNVSYLNFSVTKLNIYFSPIFSLIEKIPLY
jgi:hypothetical protein